MTKLFNFFLYLGATGFGGPLSLIQLMKQKYVSKDKTISEQEFDQVFTLIKAMPGPIAFQMAAYIGQKFYGPIGGFVTGIALLVPSFFMIISLAYFYEDVKDLVVFKPILAGFLYSTTAVILLSLKSMVLPQKKNFLFWAFILTAIVLFIKTTIPEPFLIIGFGVLAIVIQNYKNNLNPSAALSVGFFVFDFEKIFQIFKTCFYGGAFVFGTGLALIPLLKRDFVDVYGLLSLQEFNDGVIFGQMTPGPVTITASFLGFRIQGFNGALVAILAVFVVPYFHIVTWFPKAVSWLSKQKWIGPFMIGATSAVVASIVFTVFKMNELALVKPMFWITFLISVLLLILKPKLHLLYVIFGGGVLNLIVFFATSNTI